MSARKQRYGALLRGIERLVNEEHQAIRDAKWGYGKEVEAKKNRLIERLIEERSKEPEPRPLDPEWQELLRSILERTQAHSEMLSEKMAANRTELSNMKDGSVRLRRFKGSYAGKYSAAPAPVTRTSFTA